MWQHWVHSFESAFDEVHDRIRRHRVLGEVYEVVDGVFGDFVRDHGPIYAGALAFYSILSLIPLIVLFASVTGFALAQGETDASLQEVMVQIRKVIPYIDASLEDDLRTVIANRKSLGVVGFIALLMAASQVFRAVEFSLARIFARIHDGAIDEMKSRARGFWMSKLWFSVFITALLLSFLAVQLLGTIVQHATRVSMWPSWLTTLIGDPRSDGSFLGNVITAGGMVLGFVLLLKIFADSEVLARYALVGGSVFFASFKVAHGVYDFYLARVTNVGAMYGSLAATVIIVLWIYFMSSLLLLCCHLTKVVQRRGLEGPRYAGKAVAT